jgi:hypothetical protein
MSENMMKEILINVIKNENSSKLPDNGEKNNSNYNFRR